MPDTAPKPRVLLTKSFIDSHDRAIATIALALRDAAMEVVLIDYEQPEDVVTVALQEDVDIIGLSFMLIVSRFRGFSNVAQSAR